MSNGFQKGDRVRWHESRLARPIEGGEYIGTVSGTERHREDYNYWIRQDGDDRPYMVYGGFVLGPAEGIGDTITFTPRLFGLIKRPPLTGAIVELKWRRFVVKVGEKSYTVRYKDIVRA